MEKNTFPVSAYISAPEDLVHGYLEDLKNLDEWTLFSRMKEQVDENTWIGTASAYQNPLYYHIRRNTSGPFKSIEWHCGIKQGEYYQVYPTYLIPPGYIEPGSKEPGTYFHWVSFVDPARRTAMLGQALDPIHMSECRALKGALERRAGHSQPAAGQYTVRTVSIYIDAPADLVVSYLTDLQKVEEWTHRLRRAGEPEASSGEFLDEYGRKLVVTLRNHPQPGYSIVEYEGNYAEHRTVERTPILIFPCSYIFADPAARGVILHRLTFWNASNPARGSRRQIEDFHAENINIKRLVEAAAGNLATFALGTSYLLR